MKIYFSNSGCASELCDFHRFLKAVNAEETKYFSEADVIIAQFCGMSSESFKKIVPAMAILQGAKEVFPNVKVYAGGCASEVIDFTEEFKYLDGTFRRGHLLEDLSKYFNYNPNEFYILPSSYQNVVSIQRGCARKCGFCKQSYMDMTLRSRPIELVKSDIQTLIRNGYKSVMLLSENSTEYGLDLPGHPTLLDLLKVICDFEEIVQITLTGLCLDELVFNPDLVKYICESSKINEIQIEIQSLDPVVRKLMRLTSSVEEALDIVNKLSNKSIISNIMIGYPGETEEGFYNQLSLVKENNLYFLQTNIYDNTPLVYANTLPQISEEIVLKHSKKLVDCVLELRKQQAKRMNGKVYPAIKSATGTIKLLNYYAVVEVDNSSKIKEDEQINVQITGLGRIDFADPNQSFILKGKVVK